MMSAAVATLLGLCVAGAPLLPTRRRAAAQLRISPLGSWRRPGSGLHGRHQSLTTIATTLLHRALAHAARRSPALTMSLPLLQLPVEVAEQVVAYLSDASKRSLALALVGRPRPGDGASEQHVRDLQRLLLPTKILLDIEDEDRSPDTLPESELALMCTISPMRKSAATARLQSCTPHAPRAPRI